MNVWYFHKQESNAEQCRKFEEAIINHLESIVEIFEIIQEYKVERLALCTCQVK